MRATFRNRRVWHLFMTTPISSRPVSSPGKPPEPAAGPAANLVRFHAPLAVDARPGDGPQPARVLVVVEPGFDGQSVAEILRRQYRETTVDSTNDLVVQRVKAEQIDVVVLCGNQSGGRVMDLLNRITLGSPGLPVIVVATPRPVAAQCLPQFLDDTVAPLPVDAGLLLRSVREAITEPRIKRLIRLTGSQGEPRFVARNARWLSEDLQARYSLPFHWTPVEVPIPLPIMSPTPVSPQPY